MPTARAAASKAASKPAAAAKPASRAAAKPAAAKAAAKPAAKAAPASRAKAAPATTNRRTAQPADDEVDLLAGMDDGAATTVDDDDDSLDMLSELTEDGGTPWYPWDAEDQPDGIQGTVRYIGSVTREDRFGGGEAPYIEVADKDDPEFVWAVRGYATVLANQIQRHLDNGMAVGDTIAIKYFGEKENRKGDNSYKNFKVVFRAR